MSNRFGANVIETRQQPGAAAGSHGDPDEIRRLFPCSRSIAAIY
ncbi:MAG: hypothetical protein OEW26_07425 [Nitrospirota bacterium]|nr:hypothetical protein [Nitrospirota bacterium]